MFMLAMSFVEATIKIMFVPFSGIKAEVVVVRV